MSPVARNDPKLISRRWWDEHPMDYLGFEQADGESPAQRVLSQDYFAEVDRRFREAAYFAQKPGQPFFSSLIPYDTLRGKAVLEIGCGVGSIAGELARQGARLCAMDQAERPTQLTAQRLNLYGLEGRVVRGDAEQLPFADESFDYVWSWGVLHHTPRMEQAIAEIFRVLKPGGRIGIMLYHKHSLYNYLNVTLRYGVLHGKLLTMSMSDLWSRYTDGKAIGGCPYVRYYSVREAEQLFSVFERMRWWLFNQKEGLANIVPAWGGLRGWVKAYIPDAVYNAVFRRLGFALFIEASKPA